MVSSGNIRLVLAALTVMAIIGILATISLKGSKQASPVSVLQQLPQNIDTVMHNARFTEMRDGKAIWELVAERAEFDKSGDVANLAGIRMEFAKTHSAGSIAVTAEKGTFSNKSRDVTLRGKVHIQTESGISFDTDAIDYTAKTSLFRTMEKVSFHDQRLKLLAQGMEMDVREQKSRFFKMVDATVAGAALVKN
jgi:LPS export ABC transporter protein LptC